MLQVSVRQRKAVLAILALYPLSRLDTTDSLSLEDTGLTAVFVLSTNRCVTSPHALKSQENG